MLNHAEIESLIANIATDLGTKQLDDPLIIGIHTGGVWVAESIHQQMQNPHPIGTLDISFYRDDFSQIGLNPQVKASDLPVSIEDRNLILVDDVLHSGRTIRAAMNELFDYGRPQSILLTVLIEREGRELPIEPGVYGMNIKLSPHQQIKLSKRNSKLSLDVIDQAHTNQDPGTQER